MKKPTGNEAFHMTATLPNNNTGDAKHPRSSHAGFAGKHFDPDSHYLLSSSSTVFYIFPSCSCRPSKTVVKFENIRVAVFKRDFHIWSFACGSSVYTDKSPSRIVDGLLNMHVGFKISKLTPLRMLQQVG